MLKAEIYCGSGVLIVEGLFEMCSNKSLKGKLLEALKLGDQLQSKQSMLLSDEYISCHATP